MTDPQSAADAPAQRPLREVFTDALALWRTPVAVDDPALWKLIDEGARYGRAAYDIGIHFLKSPDAAQRAVAADLLGRVALHHEPSGGSVARAILDRLDVEDDTDVLWCCLVALAPTRAKVAIPALIAWLDDGDAALRAQAVQSLAVVMSTRENRTEEGIHALLTAMEDPDRDVGFFATQALTVIDLETEAVHAALSRRLFDPVDDIREEAIVGLAQRHDKRVKIAIEQALAGTPSARTFDAALALGDKSLIPNIEAARGDSITIERRSAIIDALDR